LFDLIIVVKIVKIRGFKERVKYWNEEKDYFIRFT